MKCEHVFLVLPGFSLLCSPQFLTLAARGCPPTATLTPRQLPLAMVGPGQVPASCWRKGLRMPFPGAMRLAEWLQVSSGRVVRTEQGWRGGGRGILLGSFLFPRLCTPRTNTSRVLPTL